MEAAPIHIESTPGGTDDQRVRLRGFALWSVLIALMLTLFLAALDQTIVSTALPTILSDLNGFNNYTWVVTAYLISSTLVIPIVGKLSDQFGRKWFIVAGVVIFLIGSALSGASQTIGQLITFRALQGLGAGALLSLVFTSVGDIFTPAERARWQGLFVGVFGLASVIGPSLGGWITDYTSWRWVFYVNLPVGAVALFFLLFYLPSSISARSTRFTGWQAMRRIDFGGAATAAAATILLLLGLTWGGSTYPWGSWQVIGSLVAAGVLFVAFGVIEVFAAEPILPLDLFRNQIFAASSAMSLLVGMALFAVVIYLPLFIQGVLGQSAANSGTVITPLTLSLVVASIIGGQLVSRVGRYQWLAIIGGVVLLVGIYLLSRMGVSTHLLTVTLFMIVVGVGLGLLQPVLTLAAQNALPRSRLGVGTGAVTYLRSLGSTLGTAIVGSVVTNTITSDIPGRLAKIPNANKLPSAVISAATNQQVLVNPSLRDTLVTKVTQGAIQQGTTQALAQVKAQAEAQVPAGPNHAATVAAIVAKAKPGVVQKVTAAVTPQIHTLFNQIFTATRESLALGIQHAFTVSLLIAAVAIVLAFFLKDVPLVGSARAASQATGQAPIGAQEPAIAGASGYVVEASANASATHASPISAESLHAAQNGNGRNGGNGKARTPGEARDVRHAGEGEAAPVGG
ncbi:MAG TPA: MDR family MFS transporter [Ktedonobacterales bacterium]|nr:MDR family MFS transporter [Ktedonobacterales bacterium]